MAKVVRPARARPPDPEGGQRPVTRENVVIEAAAKIVVVLDGLSDMETQIEALAFAFGWIERCSSAPFRAGETPRLCTCGHMREVHGVGGCLRCECEEFPVGPAGPQER